MDYPEILDLSPFTSKPTGDMKYRLYALVLHLGRSMGSGHYVAVVRIADDLWYRCDDEEVTQVSKEQAMGYQTEAYLLFYERISVPAPPTTSPTAGTPSTVALSPPAAAEEPGVVPI